MKKIITLYILVLSFKSFGQDFKGIFNFNTISEFKIEFEIIVNSTLSEEQFNQFLEKFPLILSPYNEIKKISKFEGINLNEHSLLNFKDENLYKDNIDKLLTSDNSLNRKLSYILIASTNDISKENILLKKLKIENTDDNKFWLGIALLSLNTKHTEELFDFIVENENFGNAHMIPMYIELDKDSIMKTSYKNIDSKNTKARILAVQCLSVTKNNSKTEELVKNAVLNWDLNLKGYAIYTIKELQIGNLLDLLKPLLENEKTRKISLEAFANSPTIEDQEFLISLLNQNKKDENILNAMFISKKIENLKKWLIIASKNKLPSNYSFFLFDQPLLESDEILSELHFALQNNENKEIISELVQALKNRTDEKSIQIMIALLNHPSSSVQYWTSLTLENNTSQILKTKKIQKLIKRGLKKGNDVD